MAFVKQGPALFQSAAAMIDMAEARGCSPERVALAYEAALLGIAEEHVFEEMAPHVDLIPLDETIDAVLAVGKMLPPELRVTSRGGLAVTPSALKLQRRK